MESGGHREDGLVEAETVWVVTLQDRRTQILVAEVFEQQTPFTGTVKKKMGDPQSEFFQEKGVAGIACIFLSFPSIFNQDGVLLGRLEPGKRAIGPPGWKGAECEFQRVPPGDLKKTGNGGNGSGW